MRIIHYAHASCIGAERQCASESSGTWSDFSHMGCADVPEADSRILAMVAHGGVAARASSF
jgi:hypothetical protein